MTYTLADLEALQQALISGERRVSFGDKTIEYRSAAELQAAIRTVAAALARDQGTAPARQVRVTTSKGFRMAWFAKLRGLFGQGPIHEAVGRGRRALAWLPSNPGAVAALAATHTDLRTKSRDLVRRNAWAQAGIEAFVANAVGTGIKPQSLSPDERFKAFVQALWRDWCEEADAAGLTDFYGLQALACRGMLEGGECLIRLRPRRPEDGLVVPLQLQLLEPEHLPISLNQDLPSGNQVRAGIGVALMNREHEMIAALGKPAGTLSPLDAQLAALLATMKCAVAHEARSLRVHTDCPALVHLWQDRSREDVLADLPQAARPVRWLRLRLVPGGSIKRPTPSPVTVPTRLEWEPAIGKTHPRDLKRLEMFDRDNPPPHCQS